MTRVNNAHDLTDLVEHYEACLEKYGATPQGVDWPNAEDLARRHDVMLDVIRPYSGSISVVDLGCGPGLFYDHIAQSKHANSITYHGIDLSEKMVTAAQARHAADMFSVRDILQDPLDADSIDYIMLCGVLTERQSIEKPAMVSFAQDILTASFRAARCGIAFNAMSTHVDWERDDLFHWGLDEIAGFLCTHLSRNFVIRNDYGLYENTVYVYKTNPTLGA